MHIDGERGRDAPAEGVVADELQRAETRQFEADNAALDDAGKMLPHGIDRHAVAQQREIFNPVGNQREDRGIAFVTRPRVRQVVELAFHVSNTVTCGRTLSRASMQDTMPICSCVDLRAPPPPAGPLVHSVSTSSPINAACCRSLERPATRRRTSYGLYSPVDIGRVCRPVSP